MSDNLRQRMQNINLGISDEPVVLPPVIQNHAVASNQFSLVVVPLNPKKQNLRAMISQMPRLWGMETATTGRIIGHNKLQFLFHSEESMNMVLRRSPWSFADWMVTVHRWSPNIPEDASKVIPFWMQIRGIPLQFLSNPTITFIGGLYGEVVSVDFDENSTRVDFVRVKFLWHIDNPLRFQRKFQFETGVNTILKFKNEHGEDDNHGDDDPVQDNVDTYVSVTRPSGTNVGISAHLPVNAVPSVVIADQTPNVNEERHEIRVEEIRLREIIYKRGKFREDELLANQEDDNRENSGFNKRKRLEIE
ncbi:uncharacterized protein LOC112087247 [Eutrema salsugineum]|uniref:uncharacterized protein LOC112087247 n=1 Tax=Eutrema salsugineum TaxID=72664 RepID=UPI000CED2666|nr:uncharacterized protein LOC112087247 [Eutrema salsugineum]